MQHLSFSSSVQSTQHMAMWQDDGTSYCKLLSSTSRSMHLALCPTCLLSASVSLLCLSSTFHSHNTSNLGIGQSCLCPGSCIAHAEEFKTSAFGPLPSNCFRCHLQVRDSHSLGYADPISVAPRPSISGQRDHPCRDHGRRYRPWCNYLG